MLSDTLHQAEREIRRYQLDYPDIYDKDKLEIDKLRCQLNAMRLRYDIPFGNYADNPFYQSAVNGDIQPHDRYIENGEEMEDIFGKEVVKKWLLKSMLNTVTGLTNWAIFK